MKINLSQLVKEAALYKPLFEKKIAALKKQKEGQIDRVINTLHEKVFSCTDCLKCANCCITTGPLFVAKDIERIAKHLKMKPGAFVEKYLKIDEDSDYVLQQVPCVFLGKDNYCTIYDVRPKACASYPHTDMRNQKNMTSLFIKNTSVCPAVLEIAKSL